MFVLLKCNAQNLYLYIGLSITNLLYKADIPLNFIPSVVSIGSSDKTHRASDKKENWNAISLRA